MATKSTYEDTEVSEDGEERRSGWHGPRTVTVPRRGNGFGFTLRHFIVYPPESSVQAQYEDEEGRTETQADGLRWRPGPLSGLEPMDTIFVKQVKEGGPAHHAGLQTGDRIVNVNGQAVTGKTYSQVIALIQASDASLKLLVVPKNEDVIQMAYQSSAYNQGQQAHKGSAQDIPAPPSLLDSPHHSESSAKGNPPLLTTKFKSEIHFSTDDGRAQQSQDIIYRPQAYDQPGQQRTSLSSGGSTSSGNSGAGLRDQSSQAIKDLQSAKRAFFFEPASPPQLPGHGQPVPRPVSVSSQASSLIEQQKLDKRCGSLDSISRPGDNTGLQGMAAGNVSSQECKSYRKYSHPTGPTPQVPVVHDQQTRLSNDRLQLGGSQERLLRRSDESLPHSKRMREGSRQSNEYLPVRTSHPVGMSVSDRMSLSASVSPTYSAPPCATSPAPLDARLTQPGSRWSADLPPTTYKSSTYIGNSAPSDILQVSRTHAGIDNLNSSTKSSSNSPRISDDQYGLTISCRHVHSSPGASRRLGTFAPYSHSSSPTPEPSGSRHSMPDRPGVSRVSERMKHFESAESIDGEEVEEPPRRQLRHNVDKYRVPHYGGCKSVVTRAALFEEDDKKRRRKVSAPQERQVSNTNLSDVVPSSSDVTWSHTKLSGSLGSLAQASPPAELQRDPGPQPLPATINIYFRSDQSLDSHARVEPSPERVLGPPAEDKVGDLPSPSVWDRHSSFHTPQAAITTNNYSGFGTVEDQSDQSHTAALRQSSYLQATQTAATAQSRQNHRRHQCRSQGSESADPAVLSQSTPVLHAHSTTSLDNSPMSENIASLGSSLYMRAIPLPTTFSRHGGSTPVMSQSPFTPSKSIVVSTNTNSITTTTVNLRPHPVSAASVEDRETKLVRRTSYLMATGRQNTTSPDHSPGGLQTPPTSQQPSDHTRRQPQQHRPKFELSLSLTKEEPEDVTLEKSPLSPTSPWGLDTSTGEKLPLQPKFALPTMMEETPRAEAARSSCGSQLVALDLLPAVSDGFHSITPPSPGSPRLDSALTTPTKGASSSNIKKLKAFFGEKTPRIIEATADRKTFDLPSEPNEIIMQGLVNCKIAVTHNKRASDRSWRLMWAVLRSSVLCLYRDKANVSPTVLDEQPISVRACIVNIAHDYTKKKNVFRLTTYNGSEYLFQAEDQPTMMEWIRNIQDHRDGDPDKDVAGMSDFVVRKMSQQQETTLVKATTSPQVVQKVTKKTSKTSLRSKSPGSYSPGPKPKKTYPDYSESPKVKDSKTWKVRMVKKFKRVGSSSNTSVEVSESSETMDYQGTFNIPLECCSPSNSNDFVPRVVEACTEAVDNLGIDNQGIYRVPGNKGAVTQLEEELNRNPDDIDIESEKWMDLNVVTSLLKSFFRNLPEPLVVTDLYEAIINANRIENPEKRMLKIKKLLHDLPDHNFETFRYLAEHLHKVAANEEDNKMDARNLAIVFGPTLIRTAEESMITMVRDMSDQCRIVESVIQHYSWFFSSWDEDVNVPVDEVMSNSMAVSGMNQVLLIKAEDLVLGDRSRDTSTKQLVNTFISAAHKKMRKKDKSKSGDSVDVDGESEVSYNERNIDREIELRRIREPAQTTALQKDSSSSSLSVSSSTHNNMSVTSVTSVADVVKATIMAEQVQRVNHSAKLATAGHFSKQENKMVSESSSVLSSSQSQVTVTKPGANLEVKRYPAYQQKDFPSFATENAKPTMLRRYSEDLFRLGRGTSPPLVNVSPGHDEVNHHPADSIKQQQLKLEVTKEELRKQDEQRRLQQEQYAAHEHHIDAELQREMQELEEDSGDELLPGVQQKGTPTTTKTDYAEKYADYISKADVRSVTSDYSTMSSTTATFDKGVHKSNQSGLATNASVSGVISSLPKTSHSSTALDLATYKPHEQTRHYSLSSLQNPIARDDMELGRQHGNQLDIGKAGLRGTRVRKISRDERQMADGSNVYHRRGSLDSLRNTKEHDVSFADSEEYDNDDMVESLTETFDEKLKIISSPRCTDGNCSPVEVRSQPAKDVKCTRPVVGPLPIKPTKQFQNPSLHKSRWAQHTDPIIGIASRFELITSPGVPSSAAFCDATELSGEKVNGRFVSPNKYDPQIKGITKSEKTDANLSKQRSRDSGGDFALSLRKSSDKLYSSHEQLTDKLSMKTSQHKSADSPLPKKKKASAGRKSKRRRHTVGGAEDLEHFKALMTAVHGIGKEYADNSKVSAWDRLQPLVSVAELSASSNLNSWLQHQHKLRHAGSLPALHDTSLSLYSSDGSSYASSLSPVTISPQLDRTASGPPHHWAASSPITTPTSLYCGDVSQPHRHKSKYPYESAI